MKSKDMSVHVENCPFCKSGMIETSDDGQLAFMFCMECECQGPVAKMDTEKPYDEALRLWNARA